MYYPIACSTISMFGFALCVYLSTEKATECYCRDNDGSLRVICNTLYVGNWDPAVSCEQWDGVKKYDVLERIQSRRKRSASNEKTSTSIFTARNKLNVITCSTRLKQTSIPTKTNATNDPGYSHQVRGKI